MIARARKGSIGSFTSNEPIFVTSFDLGSMAPMSYRNYNDLRRPSSSGFDRYGNAITSTILKDFNLRTTLSSEEFSI